MERELLTGGFHWQTMNDSRLLLQEFHTLLTEYGDKLSMTTDMYRKSLLRRIEEELNDGGYVESLTDEERQLALRWEHIYTEDSYGPQGRNLGILARALLRRISGPVDKS